MPALIAFQQGCIILVGMFRLSVAIHQGIGTMHHGSVGPGVIVGWLE